MVIKRSYDHSGDGGHWSYGHMGAVDMVVIWSAYIHEAILGIAF